MRNTFTRLTLTTLFAVCLLAVPAQATPVSFTGTFSWTQVTPTSIDISQSADAFLFQFLADTSGLLTVTQVDFVLGTGANAVAGSLYFDVAAATPGWLTFGAAAPAGSPGVSVSTGPPNSGFSDGLDLAARNASFLLSGLTAGGSFSFGADVDHTGNNGAVGPLFGLLVGCGALGILCDDVTSAEFLSGGAFSYTIHLGLTNPAYQFVGPSTFTFGSDSFSSTGEYSVTSFFSGETILTPEPASFLLLGTGLAGLAWRRKRLAGRR
ncbi:MAG: PEP-CTERM sorting domain-containing protein [Bryobacteraceae bacterium]|nr:PEP-CTERM sorting domain-containing protein [Bryobacteraceae bacterium]